MMKAPVIWKRLGDSFYQEFFLDSSSPSTAVEELLDRFNPSERKALVDHIKYLVSVACSDEDRMRAWVQSGAEAFPAQRDITDFLLDLLGYLERGERIGKRAKS